MNKEYFEHVGACQGKVAVINSNSNSSVNQNLNSYYTYGQPVTYTTSYSSSTSNPTS